MKAHFSALGIGLLGRRLLGVRIGRFQQYPPRALSMPEVSNLSEDGASPSISLVTPSFNHAKYIQQTIDSIVTQGYPHLHYVVQDALSGDGTESILRSPVNRGVDVHVEADSGQSDALNRGFARTSGEIMAYLNSDDMLLPGALHFVGRFFRDNPSIDVIYGNRLVVDKNGLEIGRWILPGHDAQVLRFIDYVPQETLFWRRRVWDRVGACINADLKFAMDWDLLLRFLDVGAKFHHAPELVGLFRAHGAQKSQANFVSTGAKEMAGLREKYGYAGLNVIQRVALHARFLMQHRRADAAFQRSRRTALMRT